ncbi:MAG: hypothetical protein LBR80_07720 [Deltaproteobacteria bacterium]|jgi:hypothetical protein|nr:hypothetical protein [Deltaproteobacteria bacterium]
MSRPRSLPERVWDCILLIVATVAAGAVLSALYAVAASFTRLIWVKELWLIFYALLVSLAPGAVIRALFRNCVLPAVLLALAGSWTAFYIFWCLLPPLAAAFPGQDFPGMAPLFGFFADPRLWPGLPLSANEILDFAKVLSGSGAWAWGWGTEAGIVRRDTAQLFIIAEFAIFSWIAVMMAYRNARAFRPDD